MARLIWSNVVENCTHAWHNKDKLQWFIGGIGAIHLFPSNMKALHVVQINHYLPDLTHNMFVHLCYSPHVTDRSRSVTVCKFIWAILIILQEKKMKFGSLEYLCGSAVYNYYRVLYCNWSLGEKFISFYPLSPVQWGESTASATEQCLRDCGGFSVLLGDALAGWLLEQGTENLGLFCSGSVSLMTSTHSFTPTRSQVYFR